MDKGSFVDMTVQKPQVILPKELIEASQTFGMLFYDMDNNPFIPEDQGDIVGAFGHCELGNQTYNRILWLCTFVARRALPCWEIYCDGRQPHESVEALSEYLLKGVWNEKWRKLTIAARPSLRGISIVDCRACDTGAASDSAASAIKFLLSAKLDDARVCLGEADGAFDQSPLGAGDHFREWLADFAVPIAYLQREMTLEEQTAYRLYDPKTLVEY